MANEERDSVHLITIDHREERHPRAILQTNASISHSDDGDYDPKLILNVLDQIYSDRTHRKCVYISYFTLLSMTLAITSWMFYWIASNRCQNIKDDPGLERFLCDLQIILETITFVFLALTPVLFLLMIIFWIHYSCHNPMDSIREDAKIFRITGHPWREQLTNYFKRNKFRHGNCCRWKQRKELNEREYGWIILSSHGIVIDELILLSAKKHIIEDGLFVDGNRLLRLTFQKTWTRPWKAQIEVYLPDDLQKPINIRELKQLLKLSK